jgi:hypothetical protein
MLMRISLFVAILAGLAVGTLNVIKVKEKVVALATDRDKERGLKEDKTRELAATNSVLKKTSAELKQTQTELTATKDERDKAVTEAASEKKRADLVTTERDKARTERNDAQAELQAYKLTELSPKQIIAINKQYKDLQAAFNGAVEENRTLGRKIIALTNELAIYKTPDYQVPLPPNLRGKILVTDPKWNFVIINVGQDQGVLEHGELLVNRNGRLVAKVKVRSVQKDRSIANVMPGWQLGEVMEGDQVIPAHPASS